MLNVETQGIKVNEPTTEAFHSSDAEVWAIVPERNH
ncbi:unnamed protein product [Brassica oleracea]|uniref:Uncharacterized protein n=1 Tax=Brassica oleracea TaxID=3712 RepID=A0A3P6DR74_BRAOL|nr:unnamed protein product [Brassica oleracea]